MAIESRDGSVAIRICTPGTLSANVRPSLGLRTVAESAEQWSLVQVDGRVDLVVDLHRR